MIVIADPSPLHYLILLEHADVVQHLYGRVISVDLRPARRRNARNMPGNALKPGTDETAITNWLSNSWTPSRWAALDPLFFVKHSDFISPEYQTLDKINPKKWEECRGLGRSFGYNRAEGEAETIAPDELIYLLVDVVSKNGNLLLDVGPEADGTIPDVQMTRLKALGAWLQVNGDAIYATHPWKRAAGETAEGIPVRFTQKDSATYAILLGQPKAATATFKSLSVKPGTKIYLLGNASPLVWSQQGDNLRVDLPTGLTGHYAYSFRIAGPVS